VDEDYIVFDLQ